jgi:hypothetical protein
MRLRLAVLASALGALAAVAVPSVADAAPTHNHHLTIAAVPNPIPAGEGVLIFGYLTPAPASPQTIVLFHHIAGSHSGFTPVQTTKTGPGGLYEFVRAEGIVDTNRSWFVREADHPGVHSRTIHERVEALVSLSANRTIVETNHPVVFSGQVLPEIHAGERVLLQEQMGLSGDDWVTIKRGRLGLDSRYMITYRWLRPGVRDLRVVFRGDKRNIRGESDVVTLVVQQAQNPDFTIAATPADIIPEGSSLRISGVLDMAGTATPEGNTSVTLLGHGYKQPFTAIQTTTTASDGSYHFDLTGGLAPAHNEVYIVRTASAPHRHTALLFEGVRDVVTINASSSTAKVGDTVTFTGSVSPNKNGHVIYLQRLGEDGDWHTIETGFVDPSSNYQFTWEFGEPGTKMFRARVPGGPENVGAASPAVTITVS